jgi:hypothetical protein
MRLRLSHSLFAVLTSSAIGAHGAITIYNPTGQGPMHEFTATETTTTTATGSASASAATTSYTGLAAYDPTTLVAPQLPNPAPATNFPIQLYAGGMDGLSIAQHGSFIGFSIEMSVSNQVCEFSLQYIIPNLLVR